MVTGFSYRGYSTRRLRRRATNIAAGLAATYRKLRRAQSLISLQPARVSHHWHGQIITSDSGQPLSSLKGRGRRHRSDVERLLMASFPRYRRHRGHIIYSHDYDFANTISFIISRLFMLIDTSPLIPPRRMLLLDKLTTLYFIFTRHRYRSFAAKTAAAHLLKFVSALFFLGFDWSASAGLLAINLITLLDFSRLIYNSFGEDIICA